MKKFEYKQTATDFADLNSLGGEGWELCAIKGQWPNGLYIFKREKVEEELAKPAGKKALMKWIKKLDTPIQKIRKGNWATSKNWIDVVSRKNNCYKVLSVSKEKVTITYLGRKHSYDRDRIIPVEFNENSDRYSFLPE